VTKPFHSVAVMPLIHKHHSNGFVFHIQMVCAHY